MNENEYISNIKQIYVKEYIDNIIKKTNINNITNGKHIYLISLYYYSNELNMSQKQAIDIVYHIARCDEMMQQLIKNRGNQIKRK